MWSAIVALAIFAAEPPPERDQALRAAVTKFANAFQEGKLRQAYPLVDEDSQEAFLDMGKIKFTKYEWQGVEWAESFTEARVTLLVDTELRMPQATVPVRRPWVLNWKWKDGEWLWVWRAPTEISTPFGTVKARPGGTKPDIDIEAEIKKAPKPEDLARTIEVTGDLTFSRSQASEAEVLVRNGLEGHIEFTAVIPRIPGMKIDRVKKNVPPGETVAFRLYWNPQPGQSVPDMVRGEMVGQPIGGAHTVIFQFKD
jgi:hypothetical protein